MLGMGVRFFYHLHFYTGESQNDQMRPEENNDTTSRLRLSRNTPMCPIFFGVVEQVTQCRRGVDDGQDQVIVRARRIGHVGRMPCVGRM